MLKKLLVAVILLVVLECVATVLLFQAIGWLAIPAVLAANLVLLFVLKKLIGRLITKAFTAPFKAKGAVLRGATAEIHSVTPASAPLRREDDEDSASGAGELKHYLVDVTVTPASNDGPFQYWEPGDIRLVLPTAKPDDTDGDDDAGVIHAVRIWQDGAFADDEGMKFPGPQRLELHVGVAPTIREVRFRYYFELFGTVRFPSSTAASS